VTLLCPVKTCSSFFNHNNLVIRGIIVVDRLRWLGQPEICWRLLSSEKKHWHLKKNVWKQSHFITSVIQLAYTYNDS